MAAQRDYNSPSSISVFRPGSLNLDAAPRISEAPSLNLERLAGQDVIAIILAAGRGVCPLSGRPRALREIDGVPAVVRCLDAAKAAGIQNIVVVVGHRRGEVLDALPEGTPYAIQRLQRGAAHAVMAARQQLASRGGGRVVVIHGDADVDSGQIAQLLHATQDPDLAAASHAPSTTTREHLRLIRAQPPAVYCFRALALLSSLVELPNLPGAERGLGDLAEHMRRRGWQVMMDCAQSPILALEGDRPAA